MDEAALLSKLSKIEALFAGATTDGERTAAASARDRIVARLREAEKADPPIEYKFTLADAWSVRLLLALLRRYDLKPYRYRGQRRTTVMVRVAQRFVDDTLWPEYQQLSATLETYLDDVTTRVVAHIHVDTSDASEIAEPKQLAPSSAINGAVPTPPTTPPSAKAEAPASATANFRSENVGRNAPCPCGSGRKYKKCHGR